VSDGIIVSDSIPFDDPRTQAQSVLVDGDDTASMQ